MIATAADIEFLVKEATERVGDGLAYVMGNSDIAPFVLDGVRVAVPGVVMIACPPWQYIVAGNRLMELRSDVARGVGVHLSDTRHLIQVLAEVDRFMAGLRKKAASQLAAATAEAKEKIGERV